MNLENKYNRFNRKNGASGVVWATDVGHRPGTDGAVEAHWRWAVVNEADVAASSEADWRESVIRAETTLVPGVVDKHGK